MGRKQALRRAEMRNYELTERMTYIVQRAIHKLRTKTPVEIVAQEMFSSIRAITQKEVVRHTLDIDWRAWIVALNDEHGHGRKRLSRTLQRVNRIYSEYNRAQTEGDLEYAEAILDRRVLQIMGEDFFLQSKEEKHIAGDY